MTLARRSWNVRADGYFISILLSRARLGHHNYKPTIYLKKGPKNQLASEYWLNYAHLSVLSNMLNKATQVILTNKDEIIEEYSFIVLF